jgi:predicted enzyme related to lactoylglutathione lyase
MNFNFIILYARDMDKVKAFYTNVLSMTVVEKFSTTSAFIALRSADGAYLALQDNEKSKLPPRLEQSGGSVELSFAVEDVDDTFRQWKEKGAEIVSEPEDLPFGRYFMAKDPEGHYLSAFRFKTT